MIYEGKIQGTMVVNGEPVKEPNWFQKMLGAKTSETDLTSVFEGVVNFMAGDLGVTNAVRLAVNGEELFLDTENKPDDLSAMVESFRNSQNRFDNIQSFQLLMEKTVGNLVVTYDLNVNPSGFQQAKLELFMTGTVQMPTTGVSAANFAQEVKKLMSDGYEKQCQSDFSTLLKDTVEKCQTTFGFTASTEYNQKVVVPKRSKRHTKSYNRNFSSSSRSYYAPSYGYGHGPAYYDDGWDFFDYLFFCYMMDSVFDSGHAGDYMYCDQHGAAMPYDNAAQYHDEMPAIEQKLEGDLLDSAGEFGEDTVNPDEVSADMWAEDPGYVEAEVAEDPGFGDDDTTVVADSSDTDCAGRADCEYEPSDCDREPSDCEPSDCERAPSDCDCCDDCDCDCDCDCD